MGVLHGVAMARDREVAAAVVGVTGGRFSSSSSISIPSRVESPKSSATKLRWAGVVVFEHGERVPVLVGENVLMVLLRVISEAWRIGVFLTDERPTERDRLRFLGTLIEEELPSGRRGTWETTV